MNSGFRSRALSWALSVAVSVSLAACGGGGAGDTPAAGESLAPAGNSSAFTEALTVAPGHLNVTMLASSYVYQGRDLSVHVGYQGDGVLVGYAPGVTPVSWLSFSRATQQASGGAFDLPIGLVPTVGLGDYSTSLRFVSGLADGTIYAIYDLPVFLHVVADPPVYEGDIVMGGMLGKLSGLKRTVALDFAGMVPDQVTVTPRSEMGAAEQWLDASFDPNTAQLSVQVKPELRVGTYAGFVEVAYNIQGAKGLRTIPFKVIVQADAPVADRVAPGYVYTQGTSTLVIRGHAFRMAQTAEVSVGAVAASQTTIVSDSEIRATFNGPLDAGFQSVQLLLDGVAMPLGQVRAISRPAFPAQDITPPCSTTAGEVIPDPMRGNLIGFCDDTYYVMSRSTGTWRVAAQRKVAGIDYDGWYRSKTLLTADQKFLVVSLKAQLLLLDPVTLRTLDTLPIAAFWPESAGYGYLNLQAALNNGKIVLTVSGYNTYYVYDLSNRTFTRTAQPVVAMEGGILNADASGASRSALQLMYLRGVNLTSQASADPELFRVTFLAAPDSWYAGTNFPAYAVDGSKVVGFAAYSVDPNGYAVYDTAALEALAPISSASGHSAPMMRFTDAGDELWVVDTTSGRLNRFGAQSTSSGLLATTSLGVTSSYAGLSSFLITPDQGIALMWGSLNDSSGSSKPRIKIVPAPR